MHAIMVEIQIEPIIAKKQRSSVCYIFWVLLRINSKDEQRTSEIFTLLMLQDMHLGVTLDIES